MLFEKVGEDRGYGNTIKGEFFGSVLYSFVPLASIMLFMYANKNVKISHL
jgi:hypothetical protein